MTEIQFYHLTTTPLARALPAPYFLTSALPFCYGHIINDYGHNFMDIEHIPAGKFKTHCLKLLDQVRDGKSLIITKHGKQVAKISPPSKRQKKKSGYGCMKGTIKIHGDIVSPNHDLWKNWNPLPE